MAFCSKKATLGGKATNLLLGRYSYHIIPSPLPFLACGGILALVAEPKPDPKFVNRKRLTSLTSFFRVITRIQERLVHILNANEANWPTNIQNHALHLLRSGEVTSFPVLMRRVLEDVRQDTQQGKGKGEANGSDSKSNGDGGKKAVNGADQKPNLALPQAVIDEAVKITRECLEEIATLE